MPLFQPSVLKKYCRDLKQAQVQYARAVFGEPYHVLGCKPNTQPATFSFTTNQILKQKIKLSFGEPQEWLAYFEEQRARARELQKQIDETDKEIDWMEWAIYGLNGDETKVMEEL